MSELSKRLRELAEAELDEQVDGLLIQANDYTSKTSDILGSELLRIAAGGKTQVLRNDVIKRLSNAMEAKLLGKLDDQETE